MDKRLEVTPEPGSLKDNTPLNPPEQATSEAVPLIPELKEGKIVDLNEIIRERRDWKGKIRSVQYVRLMDLDLGDDFDDWFADSGFPQGGEHNRAEFLQIVLVSPQMLGGWIEVAKPTKDDFNVGYVLAILESMYDSKVMISLWDAPGMEEYA